MSTAKHTRSVHIDAPVTKVFGYIEDPAHIAEMAPEEYGMTLVAVHPTPEGLVGSYQAKYRMFGMHVTVTFTREEYVPDERLVDHSSAGIINTLAFEPDATGTTLTLSWDASRLMKMLDAVLFHGDKDLDRMLARVKEKVEALP